VVSDHDALGRRRLSSTRHDSARLRPLRLKCLRS